MEQRFLTTEQVANILQVHPFTILKFIKQGKLKGVKLGRVYRIKETDVHKFIEERMTGQKEPADSNKKEKKDSEIKEVKKTNQTNEDTLKAGEHYYII